jgi:DNA-binding transcriptional LysR family regulator
MSTPDTDDAPRPPSHDHAEGRAPDLRAVETLLAVCDAGGIGAAARRIGLTQPAVSQIIRRLETEVGVRLFDRRQRPWRLTAAGELFEEQGRALVTAARRMAAAARERAGVRVAMVRAGLIDSFAATAGPALVKALAGYAETMSVWSGISPPLIGEFRNRAIDLVVTSDPLEELDGVERHLLLTEPFIMVVPRRLSRNTSPDLAALAESLPLIRYSGRSLIGAQIERHLRRLGVRARGRLEFDATEAVFAMVSGGVGWAVTTPLCLLQGRAHLGGLAAMPLPGPLATRSLYLIAREGEFSRIARACAAAARDDLARTRAPDLQAMAPWVRKRFIVGGRRAA